MLQTQTASFPNPPFPQGIGRLTTDQYFRMIETGEIREGAPYELLDGLLVLKDRSMRGEDPMSIGDLHITVVGIVHDLTHRLLGRNCFVQSQGPITMPPYNAPEPDGAIVRGKRQDYFKRPRFPSDVSSVIEVSASSLNADRNDKGPKYAEAGIPQYVILNLIDRVAEIREKPNVAQLAYDEIRISKPGEFVDFLLPVGTRLNVSIDDLMPSIIG